LRTGEQHAAEVGGDAEGVDVDLGVVRQPGELLDLRGGEELRLVDDQVVHTPTGGPGGAHQIAQVHRVVDFCRRPAEAHPRGDLPGPGPVQLGQQQPAAALASVVVVHL